MSNNNSNDNNDYHDDSETTATKTIYEDATTAIYKNTYHSYDKSIPQLFT